MQYATAMRTVTVRKTEGALDTVHRSYMGMWTHHTRPAEKDFLSLLRIVLSAEYVSGRHYRVTLDLREMRSTEPYGVTADDVIAGAIKCLHATFDEDQNLGSYELHIQSNKV